MTRLGSAPAAALAAPAAPPRPGSLDDVGAVLCAIRALTTGNGGLDEEDARAVYSLACIGLAEWRLLDAEDDKVGGGK